MIIDFFGLKFIFVFINLPHQSQFSILMPFLSGIAPNYRYILKLARIQVNQHCDSQRLDTPSNKNITNV